MSSRQERRREERRLKKETEKARKREPAEWLVRSWPRWEGYFMNKPPAERGPALESTILQLESLTAKEAGLKYVAQLKCWKCEEIWVGPPGPREGQCPACGHLYFTWLNAKEIIDDTGTG